MSGLISTRTLNLLLRIALRSLSNLGALLFAIYSIHLAQRSFGPRPKVLSRQYRPSALTDLSDPRRATLRKLLADVAPNAEARIYRSLTGVGSEEPTTTVARLHAAAALKPKAAAFMVPDFDKFDGKTMVWRKALTWAEYCATSRAFAKSLIALGFSRHDLALLASESRPEFFVSWMGVQAAGGICVSGHPWNVKTQLKRLCEMTNAKIAFVDSPNHVDALREIKSLEKIVLISSEAEFNQFLALGKAIPDNVLDADRIRGIRPGHASCALFSSGQSSDNRPVLLSHDNVTFSARAFLQHHENVSRWGTRHPFDTSPVPPGEEATAEHILSFLPLSHVGTLMLDLHVPMCLTSIKSYGACTVWTLYKNAAKPETKNTLYPALTSVRPTIFLGMPAVWDRFRRSMTLPNTLLLKQAREWGSSWFQAVQAGSHGTEPIGLYYAERYVFLGIKKHLGLDRAKLLMSSGAPIAKEQLEFFGSLGMHIMESFGATGCSGPQTMGRQDYFTCGSVGPSLPSCELKVVPVVEYPGEEGEGEICVRGRHVCIGVLNDPEATNAILDEDGFFHTNHVGRLDKNGCLDLIGRKDELVGFMEPAPPAVLANSPASTRKTKRGNAKKKKLGLSHIEAVVRDKTRPLLDRVVVVHVATDAQACRLRVFCTLRKDAMEQMGFATTTDKDLLKLVQQGVNAANAAFDNICKIEAFLLLPPSVRFSAFGDEPELTYTGQARRNIVMRKYQNELRALTSELYDSMSQQ